MATTDRRRRLRDLRRGRGQQMLDSQNGGGGSIQDRPKSQTDAVQNRGLRGPQINEGAPPAKPGAAARGGTPGGGGGAYNPREVATRRNPSNAEPSGPQQTNTETEEPSSDPLSPRRQEAGLRIGGGGRGFIERTGQRGGTVQGSSLLAQPTEEGVTQFQRRQHRDRIVEQRGLRNEAFGSSGGSMGRRGSAVDQLRSGLTGGMSRMDRVLRNNDMTEAERQAEAAQFADAAQSDAEALRQARGLRQNQDQFEDDLAYKERDSVRDFQASLADAASRGQRNQRDRGISVNTPLAELSGFSREDIARDTGPAVTAALQSAGVEVAEGEDVGGAFTNFLGTSVQQAQNLPGITDTQDLIDLYAIAKSLPEAATLTSSKGEPLDAAATLEMIHEGALNQTGGLFQRGDRLNVGSDQFRLRQFNGRARTGLERIMQNYRQEVEGEALGSLMETGKLPEGFNQHERKFAEEQVRNLAVGDDIAELDQQIADAKRRFGEIKGAAIPNGNRRELMAEQQSRKRELEAQRKALKEKADNMSLKELAALARAESAARRSSEELENP